MPKKINQLAAAAAIVASDLVEISKLSTSIFYTAATISAQASDNSYNDSAAQFLVEGFAVNDNVRVVGFTGNVVNNIFSAKITTLTAGKMTIGGTDGDVIVDDAAGESVTITKWESYRGSMSDLQAYIAPTAVTQSIIIACGDETSALTVGTAKVTFRMPFAFTLSEVRASVNTAPTGAAIIVDINEAGTSIMTTNKLSIDATEKTSETAATPPGITDTALADDAEITIDVDQVGSTIAGTGLKVTLIGTKT